MTNWLLHSAYVRLWIFTWALCFSQRCVCVCKLICHPACECLKWEMLLHFLLEEEELMDFIAYLLAMSFGLQRASICIHESRTEQSWTLSPLRWRALLAGGGRYLWCTVCDVCVCVWGGRWWSPEQSSAVIHPPSRHACLHPVKPGLSCSVSPGKISPPTHQNTR